MGQKTENMRTVQDWYNRYEIYRSEKYKKTTAKQQSSSSLMLLVGIYSWVQEASNNLFSIQLKR